MIRIWFNRGAPPEQAWVIEEDGRHRMVADIAIDGLWELHTAPGETPEAWLQSRGVCVVNV